MTKILKIISVIILLAGTFCTADAQVTKGALDQSADQAQGNYAATNLNYLGGGAIGMMQNAWKDPIRHMGEGQTRPGYTKYYWTPELVLPVRIREGMYTLINFPSWEVVENVYLGDGQSFSAEIQGPSSLMVYPETSQFVGVDTNMIVFGRSGNKYVFYVQSETVNTDRITNAIIDIEVVNKKQNAGGTAVAGSGSGHINARSYSSNGTGADSTFTRNLQKEDWIENIPVDPTKFRFDIEVYVPNPDDIIIAPERVWRDNIFTYIDLGEKALTAVQRPIVTLIVERSETPVGFRSAGPNNRLIIVEGMGDMVLRSGKRIVCLKLRRADSDGLENTIYAKTNEWDLQTGYASAPENRETDKVSPDSDKGIENVYGTPSSAESNNAQDFFNDSLFVNPETSRDGADNKNSSLNQTNLKTGNPIGIDALPKAKTIVNTKSSGASLTGQYDIKAGEAEMIVPDYNNQPVAAGITYVADKTEAVPENIAAQSGAAAQFGNSANNSSPVLIAAKENAETKNPQLDKETEALLNEFRSGKAFDSADSGNISIELGTDENVNNLERLWNDISKRYSAALGHYQAFYSVDTPADGQGKELFHLRVGPVKSLQDGDDICSQLGRNGIFCSVVRIQ